MYSKNSVRLELKAEVTINYMNSDMNRKQFLEGVEHL